MVRYEASVIVPYGVDDVFALLSDWRNQQHWDRNITHSALAEGHTDPTAGVGTKYDAQFVVGNRPPVAVDYVCAAYKAPAECMYHGSSSALKSADGLRFEPAGEGSTTVTGDFSIEFRGWLAPFSFLMSGVLNTAGATIMKDIKAFCDERLGEKEKDTAL